MGDLTSTHLFLYKMLIRLTELIFDEKKLSFDPFLMEIPDMERVWDNGYDYMEGLIDEDEFPDEIINQIPDHYEDFEFDYDTDYKVLCRVGRGNCTEKIYVEQEV